MIKKASLLYVVLLAFGIFSKLQAEDAEPKPLTVFAAASLTESFKEIGVQFEKEHPGVKVVFNFGGSNQLRMQLDQGAKADVFASANTKEMDAAVKSGLTAADAPKVFVRNKLAVILPKNNPAKIEKLSDLSRKGLKVVLAAEQVPVGKYALESLTKMSGDPQLGPEFKTQVLANIVSREENVKAVVTKVRLGEADAGIAYVSDYQGAAAQDLAVLEIPDNFNPIAEYPIAALSKAIQPETARQFVAWVLSEKGQDALKKYGFLPAVK